MNLSRWRQSKLNDITDKDRSITYGVVKPGALDVNGVRFIRGGDIFNGKINIPALRTIKHEISKQYKRTLLQGGELLISLVGNPGEVAIAPKALKGSNIARQVGLVALKEDVHPSYVMYFLMSSLGRKELFAQTTGSVQRVINLADLKNVRVPIPPLPTQRKIAGVLSAYDDLIENNSRRIAILEEMAQAIYREWFVNFRFPGHENVKLIDSPLGKIPEGWEVMPFSKSADFVNGYAFKPSDWATTGIPIVKIAELKNGITKKTPRYSGVELPEKYTVKTGDLLFSWSADLDAYIWPHEDGLLNQHLFTVLPFTKFTKQFLFFALLHKMPQFRSLSIGTTMRHIKRSALDQVSFVSPPSILLDEFTKQTQPLIEHVIAATKKLRVLTATRDLLLPKLISGQLDVEDLDIEIGEQPEEATT